MVFACKNPNSVYGVKPHDRNELDLMANLAPKQLNPPVTDNVAFFYADKNLSLEQGFVCIRV